jgi:hypothetical protein
MAERPIPLAAAAAVGLHLAGDGRVRCLTNAGKVVALLWSLAYCTHKIGHYPTQLEYSEYWGITDRTAQREWALFRRAFPEERSPERLARWVLSEVSGRIENESSALSVSAPPDLNLAAA